MESCFVILHFFFSEYDVGSCIYFDLVVQIEDSVRYGSSCSLAKCYYNVKNQYFFFFFITFIPCPLIFPPTLFVFFLKKKYYSHKSQLPD